MTRIVVVLPAPLGPRNPVTRPGWQTKLMSSTAANAPYFRVSPSTLIMRPDCPNGPGRASAKCHGRGQTKVGALRDPWRLRPHPPRPSLTRWTVPRPRSTSLGCPRGDTSGGWSSCWDSARSVGCPSLTTSRKRCGSLDVGLGLVAYVLVFFFRRRWPVPIALIANFLTFGSAIASGPAVAGLGLGGDPAAVARDRPGRGGRLRRRPGLRRQPARQQQRPVLVDPRRSTSSPPSPSSGGACTSAPAASSCGPCGTAPSAPSPSRSSASRRRGPTSGPGSPARCTTCSPTGSRRSPCTRARSPSARTSPPSRCTPARA